MVNTERTSRHSTNQMQLKAATKYLTLRATIIEEFPTTAAHRWLFKLTRVSQSSTLGIVDSCLDQGRVLKYRDKVATRRMLVTQDTAQNLIMVSSI